MGLLTLRLSRQLAEALERAAQRELRLPADQAVFYLEQALGLRPQPDCPVEPEKGEADDAA